jgi:hypothetical protein
MIGGHIKMRIDFNRICKLAGVESNSRQSLNEASRGSWAEDPALAPEKDTQYGKGNVINEESAEEGYGYSMEEDGHGMEEDGHDMEEGMYQMEEDPDEGHCVGEEKQEEEVDLVSEKMDDEMVEVDIKELMAEIRRVKRIRAEKQQALQESRSLQENHLKRIIQQEVENMLSEIEEKDGSWIYGNRKPRRSKKGHVAQGATLPGLGFKI